MIQFMTGNLFESTAEALVNTVNCVGVMGKGVALQFKERYPENYKKYAQACKRGEVQIGKIFVHSLDSFVGPKWILNFPTKKHWKAKSELSYIIDGLADLVRVIRENHITSIALPPLGCGLGQLDWQTVKTLICKMLSHMDDVNIYVYEPNAMQTIVSPVVTKTVIMTPARAALVVLADFCQKNIFDPSLTLLKIHKVLYFLQYSGESLRLNYVKGRYGPYAKNLRHVLKNIEGTYLAGFKFEAKKPERPNLILNVLPAGRKLADSILVDYPDTLQRIEKVKDLLEGFESSNGMELLATVHYVYQYESAHTAELAYEAIQKWSSRKARIFTQFQVANAFNVLKEKGWLTV